MSKTEECYRVLGLQLGASLAEVKVAFRRLARQYHPDMNPGDRAASEKFMQVHAAYKHLLATLPENPPEKTTSDRDSSPSKPTSESKEKKVKIKVKRQPQPSDRVRYDAPLSEVDRRLKRDSYDRLQYLFRIQKLPRAIALVEALAERLPKDVEIRQWQAVTYHRFGRYLVDRGEFEKARIYLKKALRTDPHNQTLWKEVEREFNRIERQMKL